MGQELLTHREYGPKLPVMTTSSFKTATYRGLRLYGVPALLVNHLRIADDAGLLSDADWKALGTTPGRNTAYAMGLRADLVAHRRTLALSENGSSC